MPYHTIIGSARIGNKVAVGTNCVVTGDIKDNAVIVGSPGKVISFQGSDRHINHIDFWLCQG